MTEFMKNLIDAFSNLSFDYWLYLFISIILCIFLKKIYPYFRGFMGEYWIKQELKKLSKKNYMVLNNILISDSNGTHQIDHIILSNYGIFVVEMKNYFGLIKGREYDQKWCQYLGKTKNYFMNPFHQNYGHIKCLSQLLNIDEKFFVSIICFSNQAKLSISSKGIVTQTDFIVSKILDFKEKMNDFNLENLYNIIISNNITDRKVKRKHVGTIKEKKKINLGLEKNMICPKCGSALVERQGKYEKFIGCSAYPKCKFIKK